MQGKSRTRGSGYCCLVVAGWWLALLATPAAVADIGACCMPDGSCSVLDVADCIDSGGDPQGVGTSCVEVVCGPLLWSQPPALNPQSAYPDCFWAWGYPTSHGALPSLADDFVCTSTAPVTGFHWFGQYADDVGQTPPPDGPIRFRVALWTSTADPMPQQVLRVWDVPRAGLNERVVGCTYHPDYGSAPTSCFRYDFVLPEAEWFWPTDPPKRYWLSVVPEFVVGGPYTQWEWVTRRLPVGGVAWWIESPNWLDEGAAFFGIGGAILNVDEPWDLSFVVSAGEVETQACCFADGSCIDMLEAACVDAGGVSWGVGTTCGSADCPGPDPVPCCLPEGGCEMLTPLQCAQMGGSSGAGAACFGDHNGDGLDESCAAPTCVGDTNCDGQLSFTDINPFVTALTGPSGYGAAYPGCIWLNADCNGDGAVSFGDINLFVARLSSGECN